MPRKCLVVECNKFVVAKDLCSTHYKRVQRHGIVENTRPKDWGTKEKHPLYSSWSWMRRKYLFEMCEEWKNDFWKFVEDVPPKIENAKSARIDTTQFWSKENFYWQEKKKSTVNQKEYARQWRKANPRRTAHHDLWKHYKVTLDWYEETLAKQNGVCAICKQEEFSVIRNKKIKLSVDHSHESGKIRGLLCTKCNRGLGLFKDSKELLINAIKYLGEQEEP